MDPRRQEQLVAWSCSSAGSSSYRRALGALNAYLVAFAPVVAALRLAW
jgi:hypothetical protein